jgi:NAD(P)-dependent dehydrogenase (short-subunit alcohol dehydrogenase family)
MPLAGSTVWVTGASSGIGAEVARELAARGARVAVTARDAEALRALAAGHAGLLAAPGDITDEEGIARVASEVAARLGPIDVALLNAGTYEPVLPDTFTTEVFRRHVDVNVLGTVNCIQAVLPGMLARRSGRIAVVASVTGFAPLPMAAAYGATKAFLISMCESLRADLRGERRGVEVTVIAPGFVNTGLTERNDFDMPFVIEAGEAARIIADGLERGAPEIAFPRRMVLLMKLLGSWLPGPARRRYAAGVARRRARDRARGRSGS